MDKEDDVKEIITESNKKKNKEKKRKEHDHRTFFPSIDSIFLTFDIDATREI